MDFIQPTSSVGSADRQALGDRLGPAVTFATTEHFNLQTARAGTISEANGRASIFFVPPAQEAHAA